MQELTPEALRDMLGPEFEGVTVRILDSESRLRGRMTRRFDRVDVRFDELHKELKGDIGDIKGEIGDIKGEIRELKGLIMTNVKRRKR